ncbi:MAG: hypothetical protein GY940_01315 [bacterium]|nr:hypothetical protein [bacterium]
MKRKLKLKFMVGCMIVAVICVSLGFNVMPLDAGEGKYVLVTLKDKSTVKFEHDSFEFNWAAPSVKNEFTCKATAFDVSQLKEIYVLNQTWNPCAKKDDWVFDVELQDQKSIQGFFELSGDSVLGKLFDSGNQQEIPFVNISKVSYH